MKIFYNYNYLIEKWLVWKTSVFLICGDKFLLTCMLFRGSKCLFEKTLPFLRSLPYKQKLNIFKVTSY